MNFADPFLALKQQRPSLPLQFAVSEYIIFTKIFVKLISRKNFTMFSGQSVPFHIRFISDNYEFVTETGNKGFRLTFEQSTDCS